MATYMHQQILSSTEDKLQKMKQPIKKLLGAEMSQAVFGNARLVMDGENSKIILEKRAKELTQLQRQIKKSMYMQDL